MNSVVFTPSACSSNSARPVLRTTASTSFTSCNRRSTLVAISFDLANDVPGGKQHVYLDGPFIKGGRKSRSFFDRASPLTMTAINESNSIGRGTLRLKRIVQAGQPFKQA